MLSHEIERAKGELISKYGPWTSAFPLIGGIWTSDGERLPHQRLTRFVQTISDLARKPLAQCRVLDLACLEGMFSIEFARHGATVVGIEGREGHVLKANFARNVLGLGNLEFVQDDVRNISVAKYGRFDVILCSGILYHLPETAQGPFVDQMFDMVDNMLIIDTKISLQPDTDLPFKGKVYRGSHYREHAAADSVQSRLNNAWASLDNESSFWLSRPSLINMLAAAGFTSIHECLVPTFRKFTDRCTFIAIKGQRAQVYTSPGAQNYCEPYAEGDLAYAPNRIADVEHIHDKLQRLDRYERHPLIRIGRFTRRLFQGDNMSINADALQTLLGRMVNDMGAAAVAPLVLIGDRLGLYRTLSSDGPLTSAELAQRTGTAERYVREWCAAQASSGYIEYDAGHESFSMTPEQQAVFADSDSPAFMIGGYYALASLFLDEPKITQAFKTGKGVSWGEHHECLFCGTEKFFRPGYRAHLIAEWLPALDGVVDKLKRGALVADVGCGHGASTLVMAEAYPHSTFIGFDFHDASIRRANELARESKLKNARFEVATAKTFPGRDYDLVAYFDCLHDMGDPVGAAAHTRQSLKPDGTMMVVEPFAGDRFQDNMNPVGRMFYCFSTMVCTPASLSQEVGLALGAQAGEKRLRDVMTQGGFSRFRRAAETPFNLVLEAKP